MRKGSISAVLLAFVLANPVWACGSCGCAKGGQTAEAQGTGCGKHAQTAAAPAGGAKAAEDTAAQMMKNLPHLTYRVGDFETCCPKTATEKAGENGQIQYIVAGETFDCRGKALAKLASFLEEQTKEMMNVSYAVGAETYYCPMEAKAKASEVGYPVTYRLAGIDFNSNEEAQAVAKAVTEAVAKLAAEGASNAQPNSEQPEAQAVAAKSDPAGDKPGCSKPCSHGESHAPAAKSDAAADKPGCNTPCHGGAQTASAGEVCWKMKSDACCKEAQAKVDAALAKLELIVKTAAAARSSS